MLFQPYHSTLTAGKIREYLKDYPDHAPVLLDGGDDWSNGHELYATKPKELYMPSQDSLSRRLGPVFAEVAAKAQPGLAAALAYKPTRRLPRMTHDGAYMIVMPMARWHQAANDQGPSPLRAA